MSNTLESLFLNPLTYSRLISGFPLRNTSGINKNVIKSHRNHTPESPVSHIPALGGIGSQKLYI